MYRICLIITHISFLKLMFVTDCRWTRCTEQAFSPDTHLQQTEQGPRGQAGESHMELVQINYSHIVIFNSIKNICCAPNYHSNNKNISFITPFAFLS